MKKTVIYIIIVISVLLSCSQKKVDYIKNYELIEHISKENPDLYSVFAGIYLFMKDKKTKELIAVDSSDLMRLYSNKYDRMTYGNFIKGVFSNKIKIYCEEVSYCFDLDDNITRTYEEESFPFFLKKYCRNYSQDKYLIIRELPKKETFTVMYYLYINNYFSAYDDISGYYDSERMRSIPIPLKREDIFLNNEE